MTKAYYPNSLINLNLQYLCALAKYARKIVILLYESVYEFSKR